MSTRLQQQGSVSLFIVVFAALLIITMSTAFIRIMLQDQLQATANDLSKSALDSAYAGVEDAKRAIVAYYKAGCDKDPTVTACNQLKLLTSVDANGWTDTCVKATVDTGMATQNTDHEVPVQTAGSDDQFDQAYTCVKVQLDPESYVGKLTPNASTIIPLQTKDTDTFDKLKIEWYTRQDGSSVDVAVPVLPLMLPKQADWPQNRPSVIRAQLLQYGDGDGFKLSDFDNATNNSTRFLYPVDLPATTSSFGTETRRTNSPILDPAACLSNFGTGGYACSTIATVLPVNGKRIAYLNLVQVYNTPTSFRITLLKSGATPADPTTTVHFSGVQPVVDSTGRANDLFRRVQSHINLGSSTAPDAAVDITDKLCKTFTVTDTQYVTSGDCSL